MVTFECYGSSEHWYAICSKCVRELSIADRGATFGTKEATVKRYTSRGGLIHACVACGMTKGKRLVAKADAQQIGCVICIPCIGEMGKLCSL